MWILLFFVLNGITLNLLLIDESQGLEILEGETYDSSIDTALGRKIWNSDKNNCCSVPIEAVSYR